jgi:hypothetical protein
MKAWLSGVVTTAAANPGALAALAALGVAIAAHYGFHITTVELTAVAAAFAGGYAHKAHASTKATSDTSATAQKEITK